MPRESQAAKAERTAKIIAVLDRTYPGAHCELNFRNPLELLVATILSAQCTDKRVNMVTAELFKKYRNAKDFADASLTELEEAVKSTGFYRNKAKNIQACCQMLVERFGGEVPRTMDELTPLIRNVNPAANTAGIVTTGCSFGGYHAVNFLLRHPDVASSCISLSGSFEIRDFLDGYYDDTAYYNNPVDYLPNLNDPWFLDRLRHSGIILGTGDRDNCRDRNLHFSHLLNTKGIPHFLDDRKWCGHDWNYWRDMFPPYVSMLCS